MAEVKPPVSRVGADNGGAAAKAARGPGRRLHGAIAHKLGMAILSGQYAPGDTLSGEVAFAEELEVSRSAYREAIQVLTAKGLVESRPKAGTRVLPRTRWNLLDPEVLAWAFAGEPDIQFVRDLFELRAIVEPAAARLAAQRRDRAGLLAMERALIDMEGALKDPAGFTEADILFHLGMALATGNTMIRVHMEGMRSVQREVSELFSRRANRSDADWHATVGRHIAINEAIAAGDAVAAERAIERHFEAADIASLEVAAGLDEARRD